MASVVTISSILNRMERYCVEQSLHLKSLLLSAIDLDRVSTMSLPRAWFIGP